MEVNDILRQARQVATSIKTVTSSSSITECINLLKQHGIGALPVVDSGQLVGIISERDIAIKFASKKVDPDKAKVRTYMTEKPITVTLNTSLVECSNLMEKGRFRHLPVLDGKRLVGIVSNRDVLYSLVHFLSSERESLERYIQQG